MPQSNLDPFLIGPSVFPTLVQVMPLGQRGEDMHNVSGMMSSPAANQSGVNSSYSSTFMDETDEYMDYMGGGGSPLGLSSESSNQDRSCTSTPVGNDGSPAGELVSALRREPNTNFCLVSTLKHQNDPVKRVLSVSRPPIFTFLHVRIIHYCHRCCFGWCWWVYLS